MMIRGVWAVGLVGAVCLAGCSSDSKDAAPDKGTEDALYVRLGKAAGI